MVKFIIVCLTVFLKKRQQDCVRRTVSLKSNRQHDCEWVPPGLQVLSVRPAADLRELLLHQGRQDPLQAGLHQVRILTPPLQV
jgi:hypothetical protein